MPRLRFSIIVTSYNQSNFILEAVDSALLQSNAEVIVVDDGSTDGSELMLDRYSDSIQLVKFKCNRGAIEARNHGAALAQGDFLVFLDGDDALMPWSTDVYGRIIATHHPKLILGTTRWVNECIPSTASAAAPDRIEYIEYQELFSKDRPVGLCASAYVVDRQAFWQAGGWSPGLFQLDLQDLSTKLGNSGKLIVISSPPTAFYRIHGANTIVDVGPFLRNLHRLLAKETRGEYPGGSKYRLKRQAWFGGLAVFWIRRALRAGLTKDAVSLAASCWIMILGAIVLRLRTFASGRAPIQSMDLPRCHSGPDSSLVLHPQVSNIRQESSTT